MTAPVIERIHRARLGQHSARFILAAKRAKCKRAKIARIQVIGARCQTKLSMLKSCLPSTRGCICLRQCIVRCRLPGCIPGSFGKSVVTLRESIHESKRQPQQVERPSIFRIRIEHSEPLNRFAQ